jgi:hypothetical protein
VGLFYSLIVTAVRKECATQPPAMSLCAWTVMRGSALCLELFYCEYTACDAPSQQ